MTWWQRGVSVVFLLGGSVSMVVAAQAQPAGALEIYWIDVEGGAATLIVTPAREATLMDAGWNRPDGRDARRILAAMHEAQITRIDYFIASHFHGDHVGGLPALAAEVDIGVLIDHGDSVERTRPGGQIVFETYKATCGKQTANDCAGRSTSCDECRFLVCHRGW